MRIKKFIAASLKEGKAQILKELGDDAVILSSRTARDPDSDAEMVEIVAALDETPVKSKRSKLRLPSIEKSDNMYRRDDELIDSDGKKFLNAVNKIYREIGSLKDMILEVSDSIHYKYIGILGPIFGKLYKALMEADFSEEYALKIVGSLSKKGTINNFEEAVVSARELITKSINIEQPIQKTSERKVVLFIGTTGSGKTTTLIKVAVICRLISKAEVLIISADTHKVGGAEQLQTFSSIASIPFQAVYSPAELKELVSKEVNKDFIFIDTVGRSQQNKDALKEIANFVESADADIVYLVQNATSSKTTLMQILDEFSILKPNAMILTKLDEAASFGTVIESLKVNPIPIAYFTNGQLIPDDIEPASNDKFGKLILPDSLFSKEN